MPISYSIASSAIVSTAVGTSMPSARAVCVLMTSADAVDCRRRPKRLRSLLHTCDHCVRPCAAFVGRRREDRQICVAARERMEADLTIPDGCKLAAQKAWRGSVFRGRPDGVYDSNASSRLECRSEVI